MNKETLKKEAIKLKQQLTEIESKIKQLEKIPLNQKLAEVLHSKLCHWNHTDGCSWEFDIDVEILIEI